MTWRADPTFYTSPRMGYEQLVREKTYRKLREDKRCPGTKGTLVRTYEHVYLDEWVATGELPEGACS